MERPARPTRLRWVCVALCWSRCQPLVMEYKPPCTVPMYLCPLWAVHNAAGACGLLWYWSEIVNRLVSCSQWCIIYCTGSCLCTQKWWQRSKDICMYIFWSILWRHFRKTDAIFQVSISMSTRYTRGEIHNKPIHQCMIQPLAASLIDW